MGAGCAATRRDRQAAAPLRVSCRLQGAKTNACRLRCPKGRAHSKPMQQLIPTQLQLTHEQRAALGRLAFSQNKGISEVVREAIDAHLQAHEPRPVPAAPDAVAHAAARFQAVAGARSGSWQRA